MTKSAVSFRFLNIYWRTPWLKIFFCAVLAKFFRLLLPDFYSVFTEKIFGHLGSKFWYPFRKEIFSRKFWYLPLKRILLYFEFPDLISLEWSYHPERPPAPAILCENFKVLQKTCNLIQRLYKRNWQNRTLLLIINEENFKSYQNKTDDKNKKLD